MNTLTMAIQRIGISDPNYEVENLRYLTVHSTYLIGRGDITVFVPPDTEGLSNLPVVVLLHGVYASHWAWTRQMNVHNVALGLIDRKEIPPMVLVMPSDGLWGEGTAYLPHSGYDYEKWIVDDVIKAITMKILQVSETSKIFISGLSMGGYGALRIGSKYNDIFMAFSGHSSITDLYQMSIFVNEEISRYNPANKDESIFNYLKNHKEKFPRFRFDCGKDDPLIEHNRKLHEQLNFLQIAHTYEEFEGGHTAEYWQQHIVRTLLFFGSFSH